MTRTDLIDKEDGENRAVRSFLMLYGGATGLSVGQMRDHMEMSGWDGCWPAWVAEVASGHHLTKGGAQGWLRYLFSLEQAEGAKNGAEGEKNAN